MDQNQTPTPTPQPDYNFIMNQQGPTGGAMPGAPKKHNKKIIILIVLLILMAIVAALVIFLPENNNQQEGPTEIVFQDNEPKSTQEQTVRQFLTYLNNSQYSQAFGLLAPGVILGEEGNIPEDWFTQTIAPAFVGSYQPSPCLIATPNPDRPEVVESLCRATDNQTATTHTYQIVDNNGVSSISTMTIKEIIEL